MQRYIPFLAASLIFYLVPEALLAQQAPAPRIAPELASLPAGLSVSNPATVAAGRKGRIDIKLLNAVGQPVEANRDIALRVTAPNAAVKTQTVTIPKGQTAAEVEVSRSQPGLSTIHIEQMDVLSPTLAAGTQIGFTPPGNYTPVPPLSVWLSISPGPTLRIGPEGGQLVARVLDRKKTPVPTDHDIWIDFPELRGRISPKRLHIAAGDQYGEAQISSNNPGTFPVRPVVTPATSVTNDVSQIEFEPPVSALRILPEPSPFVKAFWRPTINLKVGLIDAQGNWIPAEKDHTIILYTEPMEAGRLGKNELTIRAGVSAEDTTFVPYEEGKTKIKADAGGLPVAEGTIEFRYVWTFFLFLAAIGGLSGGIVRGRLRADRTFKKYLKHAAWGVVFGLLAYVLAPLLVGLSLKPEGLQNASKLFEAFVWSFVGGISGVSLFARAFRMA